MTTPTQEAVEAVRFDDCPEGLFWFGQHLGFMTEYATAAKDGFRQRDAYVVESGEYFWGGTSDPRKRAELLVFPVEDPVAALRPAGDSGEVAVKALEWNDNNIGVSYADTPFGRYRATNSGWWFGADHLTYAPSKEAAKSAAQADYDRRIRSALAAPVRSPDAVTLETYYARQIEWSRDTFGPALRTKGAIDHIRKELAEIEADPHDLSEWVDVIILAMDGFWRHGGTAESLMPALLAKQAKNMARAWPDWRTMSEDRAIEHDRSGDALSSPQPPDPAAVRVTHEVTDLLTEVGRMPADFPNYADWSVTLPAGHWRALSAALASARPEGWRTMNSAPRDGTRILATGGGLNSRVDIVEYLPNVGAWEGNGYVFDDCDDEPDGYSRPSRWMPLPPLPLKR
jgi:hypothetical protein